ncbi:SprB repeat-containing protein, partial [Flavobacterium sp. LS2P90]
IITGTISGGKAPYTVSMVSGTGTLTQPVGLGTTFTFTSTTPGANQFQVTDANGCPAQSGVITINPIVYPTATFSKVDPTCNGNSDGSIRLIPSGGIAPYQYSIDNGATFTITNVFGGLSAGLYEYVIRDKKGCEATGTITLDDPALIVPNIVMHPIVCNVNTPGSFDVTIASGGVAPFTYTLYDNTFTQIATSGIIGATNYSFGGLNFGDYYITIVDAKGCQYNSTKLRITTPPFLTLNAVTLGGDCIVGAKVDLTVIAGGVAPYQYSIFGQPLTESAPTVATTFTFNGLLHGTSYFFQVKDVNNCISILEVPIPSISSIVVAIDSKTNVTCNGANNGVLNYTVSSFDATVTTIDYELLNPLTNLPIVPPVSGSIVGPIGGPVSGVISGLKPGDYILKVKESTGTLCSALIPFNITQPIQPVNATISNETNANCISGAQITVSATGGTGPYQYAFVPNGSAQGGAYTTSNLGILDYDTFGNNWDIWVKDANGCEFKIDKLITKDPTPVIAAVLNNQCAPTEGNFAIDVTLTTAGMAPYSYSVDGGVYQSQTAPFTISNL